MKIARHIVIVLLFLSVFVNAQKIILPFIYKENSVLVKLPLNDQSKDSITYFFDTGAAATVLDKKFAKLHGLQPTLGTKVKTSGASASTAYEVIKNQTIKLTDQESIQNVDFILADLANVNVADHPFDGILGYALIKEHITKLDFVKHEISLYDFKDSIDTTGYTEFNFKGKIPVIPISIELENGKNYTGNVFFDSGARLSFIMNTPFKKKNNIIKKVGKFYTNNGNGLGGESVFQNTLIKSINIKGHEFSNIPVSLSSSETGVFAEKDIMGILGILVIDKFDVILNYSTNKLYLRPNSTFKKAFEIPVNPLRLRYSDQHEVIISDVIKESDAFSKGLKKGDRLISVNNQKGDISFYNSLLKKENTSVEIKYIDGNNIEKKAIIKLDKLL